MGCAWLDIYGLILAAMSILQPPRDEQISAGIVLAILAFTVTFLVLGILTISIKLMSIGVSRFIGKKKVQTPPSTEVETPVSVEVRTIHEVSPEEVAAAVAAIHRYLTEKTLAPTTPKPLTSPWVLAWRMDACINLNDYDYILKSSKMRRFKKYLI